MLNSRLAFGFSLVVAACFAGGCGGGLSGPNANTSAGLGTLLVDVSGAGDRGVVFLEQLARPTRGGRARFYNIAPGRYFVRASLPQRFDAGQNVNIVADKTLTISLSPSDRYVTPTPFPLKSRTASP